jgi:hypothetical protein
LYIKICSSIYRISGNSFNDGPAPPPPPPQPSPPSANTPPLTTPPAVPSSTDSNDSQAEDHVKHSKLGGGAVAGIVICLLVFGALVAFLVIKRNSWRISRGQDPEQNEPLSPLASGLKRKSLAWIPVLILPLHFDCLNNVLSFCLKTVIFRDETC